MRTRKAAITVALATAAFAATAATAAAPAFANPNVTYVGHNVSGGLVTRHPLTVGERIDFLGSNGRISNYRVTAVYRSGDAYYDTVWPRLPKGNGSVLFTAQF